MRIPSYQQLSKQQDAINNLPLDGSYLVVGPPGTGKSVMALYRAQMFKRSKRDVKLLIHSRLLSQYTASAIDQLGIGAEVEPFHAWFYGLYQRHFGRRPPEIDRWVYDWTQILSDVNQKPPPAGSIPYLIIDEGQDLPKEFYIVARHLAINLTVFADENQRIMETNSTLADIKMFGGFGDKTHVLDTNYRNTKEVAKLAATFEQGVGVGVAKTPDRSGPRPQMSNYVKLNDVVQQIVRFERMYSDLEIGVFTSTKRLQTQMVNRLTGKTTNDVQVYVGGQGSKGAEIKFDVPGIKVVNYPSTKGLEFDAVFIPELQKARSDLPTIDMQLYVLLSRAREWLFLGYSGDETTDLIERFPRELLDWT